MTPLEAIKREVEIELDALARRLGPKDRLDAVTVRIELDRDTGMPRVVDCQEERRRRILRAPIDQITPIKYTHR